MTNKKESKLYNYRIIYMEPPILPAPLKSGQIHEFQEKDWNSANEYSIKWLKENKKIRSQILCLAQLNR